MYNKIFTKILDSSIWLESTPTRIVWLTFIAVMDEKGFAPFAALGNVANRARVTLDEARTAIQILEGPDSESSDPDNDGRRLERVPGGWIVLNAEKHRDLVTRAIKQAQTAERVRRHRALKRTSNADVTPSEAYSEEEERSEEGVEAINKLDPASPSTAVGSPSGSRTHRTDPIIGRNPHLDHAACDDGFSYCVPSPVHRKLADLLAPKYAGDREAAKEALQKWYPTIWAIIPDGMVMGDAFRFWQSHFDTTFASTPTTKPRKQTTAELTEAVRAAMVAAGEL